MKIDKDFFFSPQMIFIFYMAAASALVMCFRYIFPGSPPPLPIFSRDWRLTQGALELFNLFPVLALSALVIPFGIVTFEDSQQSFSKTFFQHLLTPVIITICAAVVYGLIFFLALPLVKNHQENLRFRGELYQQAKERMLNHSRAGEWQEASQFFAICNQIWNDSPELSTLGIEISINLSEVRYRENEAISHARAALQTEHRTAELSSLPGQPQPLDAAQAIAMGEEAFGERRFFDAHWLATVGGRIAIAGSPEAAAARRLAGRAWNQIEAQSPSRREERQFSLFNMKRSGYQAMNAGNWIRAYYIFLELESITPDDPDVERFLAACEQGANETAFFIDEMEVSLGEILTGAVFSLPGRNGGRAVLRFSSLSLSDDYAYGMGFEYMSFDGLSRPILSLSAPYAKLLPFRSGGDPQVLILTHALDRHNGNLSWDSETLLGRKTEAGVVLDLTFEEFLLLAHVRHGLTNLQINDLFEASNILGDAGYVAQIFQAEILNRLGAVIFFLPMAVVVIIVGWRYRAKIRPRYLFFPFFAILPVVLRGFVYLYRAILNTAGIWLILTLGFSTAFVVFIVAMVVSFFVSLILLAAQHG